MSAAGNSRRISVRLPSFVTIVYTSDVTQRENGQAFRRKALFLSSSLEVRTFLRNFDLANTRCCQADGLDVLSDSEASVQDSDGLADEEDTFEDEDESGSNVEDIEPILNPNAFAVSDGTGWKQTGDSGTGMC